MKRLFLDAVTSNVDAFKHLGRSLQNEHFWTLILMNYARRLQGMGRLQRCLARHLSQKDFYNICVSSIYPVVTIASPRTSFRT
jgi:hypothetical protein